MRSSDWSSDVGSSDLGAARPRLRLDHLAQAIGDHDQDMVALGMAEAVIDFLEAVEVDEQQGHPFAGAASLQGAFGLALRSEARRGGKECGSTGRSRGSPYHYKKKTNKNKNSAK